MCVSKHYFVYFSCIFKLYLLCYNFKKVLENIPFYIQALIYTNQSENIQIIVVNIYPLNIIFYKKNSVVRILKITWPCTLVFCIEKY